MSCTPPNLTRLSGWISSPLTLTCPGLTGHVHETQALLPAQPQVVLSPALSSMLRAWRICVLYTVLFACRLTSKCPSCLELDACSRPSSNLRPSGIRTLTRRTQPPNPAPPGSPSRTLSETDPSHCEHCRTHNTLNRGHATPNF